MLEIFHAVEGVQAEHVGIEKADLALVWVLEERQLLECEVEPGLLLPGGRADALENGTVDVLTVESKAANLAPDLSRYFTVMDDGE